MNKIMALALSVGAVSTISVMEENDSISYSTKMAREFLQTLSDANDECPEFTRARLKDLNDGCQCHGPADCQSTCCAPDGLGTTFVNDKGKTVPKKIC